jgi:hypothetical protein
MGTLQLRPEFFDVYLDLAVDFDLPLRLSGWSTQQFVGFPFRELAAEEGIVSPDHLVVYPGVGARQALTDTLADLRPGVTELYVHPAVDSAELRALAPDSAGRVDDLRLMTETDALDEALLAAGAELVGWRALRDLQRAERS